jgi:HAD superfamily hydrolase (TIGR01490 family)
MSTKSFTEEMIPPEGIKLAFFDLDETITFKDTDLLWALWRSRRSPRGWLDLIRLSRISRLYYNHTLSPEQYAAYHLKRARSMKMKNYKKMAARFASDTMARFVYPSMIQIIEDNRKRGIMNVLITAQDEIIGSAFQDFLELDACMASSYIIEDEKVLGMKKPLCFQEGKVHWAQEYLDSRGISWKDCAFYTDSLNDRPLLEACEYPVTVHPGKELSALAAERSWPVFRPERP